MKIKLSDVAEKAGVDVSTVSRVLNKSFDKHKYSDETVAKIENAATTLGYQPSLAARSLRTGKTMLIGVIVSDISNPFFSEITSYLDSTFGEYGYRLMISNTSEDPERQSAHISGMLSYGVDGLIVSPSGREGLTRAVKAGLAMVTIDRPVEGNGFSFVGIDNIAAGRMLATELSSRGYKNIGVVVPEIKTDLTFRERLKGLKLSLKKDNCNILWTVRVPPISTKQAEIQTAIEKKLKSADMRPDAIVGLSNVCTMGIVEALADMEIGWGESLGVAGIDDFSAASLIRPAVAVVSQPLYQIADETATLLLKQMKSLANRNNEIIMIKPVWIERSSLPKRMAAKERKESKENLG